MKQTMTLTMEVHQRLKRDFEQEAQDLLLAVDGAKKGQNKQRALENARDAVDTLLKQRTVSGATKDKYRSIQDDIMAQLDKIYATNMALMTAPRSYNK